MGIENKLKEGWKKFTLQELLNNGVITSHLDGNHGGLYPKKDEFVETGVPYISANCISNGKINFNKSKYLTYKRASALKKGIAKNGDVLFAHNATVGPVAILETKEKFIILSTSLTYYRCNSKELLPDFLKYYMTSDLFKQQYKEVMGQATRNQVPITKQRSFFHIYPPLPEQKRIVQKLDALFERIDKAIALLKENIAATKELMDAVLGEVFEELGSNWPSFRLEEKFRIINGRAYKRPELLSEGKYQVIRIQNLNGGNNWYYSDLELNEGKYCEKGDLLYSWSGTPGTSFGAFIWGGDKAIYHYHIWKVELLEKIDKSFAYFLLKHLTQLVIQKSHGVTGMMHITKGKMEKLEVKVPELKLQKKIAQKVQLLGSRFEPLLSSQQQKLQSLHDLKTSLLDQAFKGAL